MANWNWMDRPNQMMAGRGILFFPQQQHQRSQFGWITKIQYFTFVSLEEQSQSYTMVKSSYSCWNERKGKRGIDTNGTALCMKKHDNYDRRQKNISAWDCVENCAPLVGTEVSNLPKQSFGGGGEVLFKVWSNFCKVRLGFKDTSSSFLNTLNTVKLSR